LEVFAIFKRFAIATAAFALLVALPAITLATGLDGLLIFAHDGTFLGAVTCSDLGNRYSRHGNKYGSESIWNKYSRYGSEYSSLSPYNPYTSTPPVLVDGAGDAVGHLTANRFVANSFSPVELDTYLMETCGKDESYRD
jgi:hypothetical protein